MRWLAKQSSLLLRKYRSHQGLILLPPFEITLLGAGNLCRAPPHFFDGFRQSHAGLYCCECAPPAPSRSARAIDDVSHAAIRAVKN